MTLAERRRALTGVKSGPTRIDLYKDGVVSAEIGPLYVGGYQKNTTNNLAAIQQNDLYYHNENVVDSASYIGGNSFSSTQEIPAKYIGKTLHVKGQHKNTYSGSVTDYANVVIADAIANADTFASAYGTYINKGATFSTKADFTEFELVLPITRSGYLSLVGRKTKHGKCYIKFTEVWIE